jgi:hypothetical protein
MRVERLFMCELPECDRLTDDADQFIGTRRVCDVHHDSNARRNAEHPNASNVDYWTWRCS